MSQETLTAKLADMIQALDRHIRSGVVVDFGVLRGLLGERRVILLPNVKDHQEVTVPQDDGVVRVRTTVVLEVQLLDADSSDRLTSRWVGRAFGDPAEVYDAAITEALENFLHKTFLLGVSAPSTKTSAPTKTQIRRRPQGASASATEAAPVSAPVPPPAASNDDQPQDPPVPVEVAPETTPEAQLELLEAMGPDVVAELDGTPEVEPAHMSDDLAKRAWKAANAQWRVLVSRVVAKEVMDLYEDALESRLHVDSWRKVSPDQIRENAHMLRRRSETTSDTRRISDREEYILAQIPGIPPGSSLDRVHAEIDRLVRAVTTQEIMTAFMTLYLEKMKVSSLTEIKGSAVIALVRKLRKLHTTDRQAFIHQAIGLADHEAA